MNSEFDPPLSAREVIGVVESVWKYKAEGKLMIAGQQNVVLPLGKDDIRRMGADATHLLAHLKATRGGKRTFTIPQKATAQILGWGSNRVKKAIDNLINTGLLRKDGTTPPMQAIRYRFAG